MRGPSLAEQRPERRSNGPWSSYRRSLAERPLLTKSLTAAFVSALGEAIATALRRTREGHEPSVIPSVFGARAVPRDIGDITSGGDGPGVQPSLGRRLSSFFIFGLLVNGPVFHWWYRKLEVLTAGGGSSHVVRTAKKIALDRTVLTPPFLLITLVGLRWLQGHRLSAAFRQSSAVYRGALLTNWKVWTLAQIVNFSLVPLEMRAIFGNLVACWWNIYLSLLPQ